MDIESYYYNCSPEYISSIHADLHDEILAAIDLLPKRQTQSEINADLFWILTAKGWYYDTVPQGYSRKPPEEFGVSRSIMEIKEWNKRDLCRASTTLETRWHADFAKSFGSGLVQIEAQFGKVEAMFKDFCGFRIAYAERRLALGIEIVLSEPMTYFAHRKNAIGGMASFNIAKNTLNVIGLNCPMWLIGIADYIVKRSTMSSNRRRVFGDRINFKSLSCAPVNEHGVVYLFGVLHDTFDLQIESIQAGFPDCIARI